MADSDQVLIQLKILKLKGLRGMTPICLVLFCMKQCIPQIMGQSPGARLKLPSGKVGARGFDALNMLKRNEINLEVVDRALQ